MTALALAAYQRESMRDTLYMARSRSSFYRQRLAASDCDITDLQDLARLPFTTSQEIRDTPLGFVCVSQDEIARVVTLDTSGTTGSPKRLYFTAADQELTVDFFRVGMSTFTSPGDRVLILLPAARPGSVGDLLATALERLDATGIRHGPVVNVTETIAVMGRERITGLVGAPTQVLALARDPSSRGIEFQFALLTTDYVPDSLARAVEERFRCTVYNHYGMTEMGLGGGVECQARRGYHLREADLLFEVIDAATGAPMAEGETGEVVFTTLTREGMPLIRYRTGDLAHFIPGPCPCGATLRTLSRVEGRIANTVTIGTGGVLSLAELDEALFALPGVTDFGASLKRGKCSLLCIDARIAGAPDQKAKRALKAALISIEAIRRAQEDRSLSIQVSITRQPPDAPPRLAKRILREIGEE